MYNNKNLLAKGVWTIKGAGGLGASRTGVCGRAGVLLRLAAVYVMIKAYLYRKGVFFGE